MTTLNGREVCTRRDLMDRYGMTLSPLEKWYRNRHANGHPEAVGTVGRELVWDREEWDAWYQGRGDTGDLESRADLAARHALARGTLDRMWALRGENGHPEPVKTVEKSMYWDSAEWDAWYAEYRRKAQRAELHVDRSGDPEDLVTLAQAARILGVEPTSITHYPKNPPRNWPQPVQEEELPSGRMRRRYRRADIWRYADTRTIAGPRRRFPSRSTGPVPGREPSSDHRTSAEEPGQ
ncbi:hypothetical protein ACFV0O_41450 [Kitasatospora sp. NPDC059577]|uniref:hypothetical protein n=1 Tax=unclassified Kitasatospora TaxID=2633591 RepID=UPI0036854DF7